MKLFKTSKGIVLAHNFRNYLLEEAWDTIINQPRLFDFLSTQVLDEKYIDDTVFLSMTDHFIQAPISKQEVWAAGVTYLRSRDARMEESKDSGGADFYSKVYHAERPELFFKALPHRVAAHKEKVFIRNDSKWNVPEPELTLFINSNGEIQGYTIGNDMSSRDIEGENPLYLPQAKVYEKSAALGPCLYVPEQPISLDTTISIVIQRDGTAVFNNEIQLNRMKRNFSELAEYLFRECDFEHGVFLMTGTGIVPPNDFTLHVDDTIEISIDNIGTLANTVAYKNT
ncbi:MAG: fumarylacetoacetate hydrolase family protein [Ginsengibacter sp.]